MFICHCNECDSKEETFRRRKNFIVRSYVLPKSMYSLSAFSRRVSLKSLFKEIVVVENGLFLFSREKLGIKRGKPIGFLSNELFLYLYSFQNDQRTFAGMEPKKSRGLEFGSQNASIHRRISRDG